MSTQGDSDVDHLKKDQSPGDRHTETQSGTSNNAQVPNLPLHPTINL